MTQRLQYDLEALTKALERDKSKLVGTYDKITKRTIVQFICSCGEQNSKTCLEIVTRAGAFCKECTKTRATKKLQERRSKEKRVICNTDSLQEVIIRDNALLLDRYEVVTINTLIKFKCSCGEDSVKNCLQLIKVSGAFCKVCTRKTWTKRQKETNIEKYGVECNMHATHIKSKIIENNIKNYGVENLFQSQVIKDKIKHTLMQKYGTDHNMKNAEIRQKVKNTNMERYGTENPMYREEVKQKIKQTTMVRYGVEHVSQTDGFKEKCKQTCLEKYGVEHISQLDSHKEKVKKAFMEHFGVDNPNKTKEIRDKIKKTCIERYGVEYPHQNPEIMENTQKSARKYKEYTMPSGAVRNVQGYEPFALNELIKQYTEENIKTDRKDIPRITYEKEGKTHYYFPDIYIPTTNTIIEVKSTWTYTSKLDGIKEKEDATKAAGYNYDIWIYDKKGTRVDREKIESQSNPTTIIAPIPP
jgi:hypothetical protein